eukprot:12901396-Prorocentrum_lima.AAC.1
MAVPKGHDYTAPGHFDTGAQELFGGRGGAGGPLVDPHQDSLGGSALADARPRVARAEFGAREERAGVRPVIIPLLLKH